MEEKKIRIDKETASVTVVLGNKYWCAVNVNNDFMDKALEYNSLSKLENLFKTQYMYRND